MSEHLITFLAGQGYSHIRQMPNTEFVGIMQMMFTYGLFVGLDETGYKRRYCYEYKSDAVIAAQTWDGKGDPPGPWIKEKPSDRLGPGAVGR
jgi:hypothetical protein